MNTEKKLLYSHPHILAFTHSPFMETTGLEPATPAVQGRCSPK